MALVKYVDLERLARFKENLDTIFAGKKNKQTVVRDPAVNGTSVSFIDTISQNDQGVISPTKKTIKLASPSENGLMSAADKMKIDNLLVLTVSGSLTISDDETGIIIDLDTPQASYGETTVFEDADGLVFTFVP